MSKELRKHYNYVDINDFEYYEKLSEGAYGLIIHVKKKATGSHFAMKLQHKALLIRHYKEEAHRVVQEMQAIACCDHPFIISISYAFQTPTLAIMTMPLCIYGDLGVLIMNSTNKRVPLPSVVFYAAEIISALSYLHNHGLIYRDLKPANVLLHGDGHILLSDFGAVADVEGYLGECVVGNRGGRGTSDGDLLPLFRNYSTLDQRFPSYTLSNDNSESVELEMSIQSSKVAPGTETNMPVAASLVEASVDKLIEENDADYRTRDRAKSIVGTIAYMYVTLRM